MSIRYKIVKHSQLKNTKQEYHAIPFSKTFVDSEIVAHKISEYTSFTESDYVGIIRAIQAQMIDAFKHGMPVKINRIGKFTLSLGVKKEINPGRASNISVYVKTINYEPDQDILTELMDVPFKKVGSLNVNTLDPLTRLDRIVDRKSVV